MQKLLAWFVVSLVFVAPAFAANVTIEHTTGQSNAIRTTLIPARNAEVCKEFGLASSCSTADLVAAGCVNATHPIAPTVVTRYCQILTQDATGEDTYIQEIADAAMVRRFIAAKAERVRNWCANWPNRTQAERDAACTAVGLQAGCDACE